ncbi:pyridoxal phosphate-dependent aminotransferase [Candidatus Bipolaricaulota bacterium]|nr:pyridoxal phosphate-dependent aminotransferase [Candidatus Bipolaricaulota bacterium]
MTGFPVKSNIISEINQNVADLEPEGAYRVLAKANELEEEGEDIVHLEIGQPDYPTFPNITLAGIRALVEGKTDYNPSQGIPQLREAIADHVSETREVRVTPDEVAVGPGAKPMLFFSTVALLEEGDEVIYPDPGFPTYKSMIEVAGGKPIPVPLIENDGFRLDIDRLESSVNSRTKYILINSPGNPAGNLMSPESLERIATLAREEDVFVLSDEIYSRIVYGEYDHRSIMNYGGMKERTIMVDGFSKTYSMTGWRLGFAVTPEPLAEKIGYLLTHSVGCTATFTQYAGIEALEGPQDRVRKNREVLRKKRDLVVEGLNDIEGVTCNTSGGAFYVFPKVDSFDLTSSELADYLLEEAGVALLPGTAFGPGGDGYLRICYANSLDRLKQALTRLRKALSSLKNDS